MDCLFLPVAFERLCREGISMLRKSIFRYLIIIALCAAAVLCASGAFAEERPVPEPNAGLEYCEHLQNGFYLPNDWYNTAGTLSATDAGTYQAVFTLKNAGDTWTDGSTGPKTVEWTIAPYTPADAPDIQLSNMPIYDGTPKTQLIKPVMLEGFENAATYELSDNTRTDVGEYTLTVTGTKNFAFTATKTWHILSPDKIVVDTTHIESHNNKPVVAFDEGKLKTSVKIDPERVKSTGDKITIKVEATANVNLTDKEKRKFAEQFYTKVDEVDEKIYAVVDINISYYVNDKYVAPVRKLNRPVETELTAPNRIGNYIEPTAQVVRFHYDDSSKEDKFTAEKIKPSISVLTPDSAYLIFENDLFSKFAIIDGNPLLPKTGDETPLIIYAASIVLAAGAIWFLIRRRAR